MESILVKKGYEFISDDNPVHKLYQDVAASYGRLAKTLPDKPEVRECLGQCFCAVGALAAVYGLDPRECLVQSIGKFAVRDRDRYR